MLSSQVTLIVSPNAVTINQGLRAETEYLKLVIKMDEFIRNIKSIEIYCLDRANSICFQEKIPTIILDNFYRNLVGVRKSLAGRIKEYLYYISTEDANTVTREYAQYQSQFTAADGIVAGIGAYIALLYLKENDRLHSVLPFDYQLPFTTRDDLICTQGKFNYLTIPLTCLQRVARGFLLQLIKFVVTFINLWSLLFVEGSSYDNSRGYLEIITGLLDHLTAVTKGIEERLERKELELELRLKYHLDSLLGKPRRGELETPGADMADSSAGSGKIKRYGDLLSGS